MLIKNGTINTMAASGIIKADIRVQDGRIAAVGENLKEEAGELIIDASGSRFSQAWWKHTAIWEWKKAPFAEKATT